MLVSQVLKSKGDAVFTVTPSETLSAVAAMLYARRVGAMVVVDAHDQVVGILSERDVVRVVAEEGAAALSLSVADCMTRDVVFAGAHESVDALLERMTDRRMRHLPIIVDGRLAGIVSIGDLVKFKIAEAEAEAEGLRAYIHAA